MGRRKHFSDFFIYCDSDSIDVRAEMIYGTVTVSIVDRDTGTALAFERFKCDDDGYMSDYSYNQMGFFILGACVAACAIKEKMERDAKRCSVA